MTTTYAILATVSLQHDYYADSRCPDFEISPSAETAAALKGATILTKTIGNSLILLIKMDGAETFLSLPADLKLSFYLQLTNPAFLNFSNVPYLPGSAFYFTNLYGTSVGGNKYLNLRVPAFSNSTDYAIGDMVLDGGNIHEAIKPVAAGSNPTSDTAFWQQRSSEQYAHKGDIITLSDGVFRVNATAAKDFDITVFKLNTATRVFDVMVGSPQQQKFSQNVSGIVVNLQDIAEGKYKVVVNGQEHYVYVDRAASYGRVFGIVELYNQTPAGAGFDLIDASSEPAGTEFIIRFANRLAIWKYITRTTQVTGVQMTAVPNAFIAGTQPKQFVSAIPMPLRQQPIKTLQVMNGGTVLASRLANPPPERIALHTDGNGNKYFCAEMYLNY
jgi:hypothetical protein